MSTPAPASASPGPETAPSPPPPPPPAGRRSARPPAMDPLSDRATSLLIRRTLCPSSGDNKARDAHTPIDELLPPLTSRNDVDLQLYALIAIVLREFVQSWYSKVTGDDQFVAEIVHIMAHCSRALEQRFRNVDLEGLLLDEIPDLLDRHITAFRVAHGDAMSRRPVDASPREIYHALCPLPQLAPVPHPDDPLAAAAQRENEALYRQLLVQAVLAVLLPTEDLENACLTSLVEQIVSELVIGNVVANKASQPWLLYEAICISARVLKERRQKREGPQDTTSTSKQPPSEIKSQATTTAWSARGVFLGLIQLGMLLVGFIRFVTAALTVASSLPPRRSCITLAQDDTTTAKCQPAKAPVLSFRISSCLGNLAELDLRMPWLHGFLSLLQLAAVHGPGRLAGLDGPVDRLLSHHVQSLLSPDHLPPLLRTLRGVLFPNNSPGQPSLFAPESDAQLHALRRRAAHALWSLLPSPALARLYLGGPLRSSSCGPHAHGGGGGGGDDEYVDDHGTMDEMDRLLSVLEDEYCNKHLMYSVVELILVRLLPELTERGVVDLQEERLG